MTSNTLTPRRLASVLRTVPEKNFRIFELAPQLVDETGKVDINKAMTMQGELNLAIAEVQLYVGSVKNFRHELRYVESSGADEMDDEEIDGGEDEW